MYLLKRFFLMLLVLTGAIQAADIPGYIGEQSFRLTDDPELNNVLRRAEDAKVELVQVERAQAQIGEQLRTLENQQRSLKEKMEMISKEIESMKNNRQALVTKLEELKKTPDVNAAAITETQAQIDSADAAILEKSKMAGAIKLESAPLNVRVDQVRNDFNNAARRTEEASKRLQMAVIRHNEYREDLIVTIKKINYEGSRAGQTDGNNDGATMSAELGYNRGNIDGNSDGLQEGTIAGQERFYARGAEQGERDGSARGRANGQKDGTNEGIISGNKAAGDREGRAAGTKRAEASNAAQVGIDQGKKAGLDRAVQTGKADGRNIGETETTKKLESGQLNTINLSGPFAGSFQRRTPDYPGDFNGANYRPNINHSKDIMRRAFADGYVFSYRQNMRFEFQRRINVDYNQSYDTNYKVGYDSAVNRDYPTFYEQGRKEGDARAYNRDYPIAKAAAYKTNFEQTSANPARASLEYRTSYTNTELATYNSKYEDIRQANFARTEVDTFGANIVAQTEIYRTKRTNEVSAIYNNNAVLEFVSSDMLDGGIKGVAMLDGVFQPGETTNHVVTLRNFGFKDATNVSVILDNGASVKLPSIPARSVAIIKGAAQGTVAASLNNSHKSVLKVVSPLASDDAVEARHFDKLAGGILKEADVKSVRAAYPITISSLVLDAQLLKGVKNKLRITLSNASKREYKGELKIKLLANSQNDIITKEFSSIAALQSSVTLSDAEVLVDSEQDIYRDISIAAKIEQNGVVIGVLSQDYLTMAKAKFTDKGKLPVVIANSITHLDGLLDTLESLGGSDKVAILDLSIPGVNATAIAEGLSQKALIVIDDANGQTINSLNGFIAKSKGSAFILVDDSSAGIKNVLKLASLKDAPKLSLNKRQVVFSNPHRAAGVLKSSAFIQSNLAGLARDIPVAQSLTLTAQELIAEMKLKVTAENFVTTPSETLKVFTLKAIAEILAIDVAYEESGGIFSRDKKWAEMIGKDATLFINEMKTASKGDVVVSRLPVILSSIALKKNIESALDNSNLDVTNKITGATKDVLSDMAKNYEKSMKKDFKSLYNKADEKASLHTPFTVAN